MEEARDYNEISDSEIAEIPDKEIIKEDDRATDMSGFETYLKMVFGEKFFTA